MPTILDLPFPVSVNAVWRHNAQRTYRSPRYTKWLKEANILWLAQKRGIQNIHGEYHLEIFLSPPDKRQRDLGNMEKILSDFAQKAGVIDNDHLCRKLTIQYGSKEEAPLGARMIFNAVGK